MIEASRLLASSRMSLATTALMKCRQKGRAVAAKAKRMPIMSFARPFVRPKGRAKGLRTNGGVFRIRTTHYQNATLNPTLRLALELSGIISRLTLPRMWSMPINTLNALGWTLTTHPQLVA